MNSNSRTKNSAVNLIINISYQALILIITFITRRIFIKSLGIDYLGISGLFSNILELFALAELGIGSAISYSMYKYLAQKNTTKLQELNTYYKTLYNRIALIVLAVGLSLLPFLKYIINLETEISHIELYYLINLLNSVFSYLFVYKTTIVNADQNDYKLKLVNIFSEVLKCVFQILTLLFLKNYLVYLLIQVFFTFLSNLFKSKMAEKWYPFIKEEAELPNEEKKDLWNNIKSMFFYKMGNSVMNHTDDILTSIIVSTTTVGFYSNYVMIYTKISSFINLIFGSITASIGNMNVDADSESQYKMYKVLEFMSYILFAIASIGIWFVADDVVTAICGSSDYLLNKNILIIVIINYYCMGLLNPNCVYRQTSGLFKLAKYSMLICCIINIILSIILGNIYGLFGIILASVISRLLTNIWYEPYILYTKFFGKNPTEYFVREGTRAVLVVLIIIMITPIINMITFANLYLNILIKSLICLIIPSCIFIIVFRKNQELKYLLDKAKVILRFCYKSNS